MNAKNLIALSLLGLSLTNMGCSFYARSQKDYRDATTKLLKSKDAELDTCYDNVLKTTPNVGGKVTVEFKVEEKTGKIEEVKADPARTSAPQPLVDCVTTSLAGLVLDPADQRTGLATFEYEFKQKK
jgi:hypothetical protein